MRVFHDVQPNFQRASERDLVNRRMPGQVRPDIAEAVDDVHDSFGDSSFDGQLGHPKCRKRGLLGSLHDNGAASSKRGCQLVGLHDQRHIPGNDLPDNSNWLSSGGEVERAIHADRIPSDFVYPSCVVAIYHVSEVQIQGLGEREGFSIINSFDFGQLLCVLLNQISEFEKTSGSISRIHPAPRTIIKRRLRCLDSHINILLRTPLHLRQEGLIRWIGQPERLIPDGVNEFAIDEVLGEKAQIIYVHFYWIIIIFFNFY